MTIDDRPTMPTLEWVMVDPITAAEMLTHNTHNRNVKRKHYEYAEDMRSGAWRHEACDPIRFADNGTLLDGQNRLLAVIESDCTIPFLVVRGLPQATQSVMDSGVPRQFADVLKLAGEDNNKQLAAITRLAWEWERGPGYLTKGRASNSQLLTFLSDHPELRHFAGGPIQHMAANSKLPAALLGALWWVFDQIDAEDAEDFFVRLGRETGHEAKEPIFELRRTLRAAAEGARSRTGQRDRVWMMAVTIKAWNAYRAGETVSIYKWRPGGKNPEAFPTPK